MGNVGAVEHADNSVRQAVAADADAIAEIQVRGWRAAFATVLPAEALEALAGEQARKRYAEQWRASATRPPSSHHKVLVAQSEGTVTGVAACAPCTDEDCWPRTDAELLTLAVDPDRRGEGHGSRLLNAAADLLREDTYQTLVTWAFADDRTLHRFLESSGWMLDGSRRGLDLGELAAGLALTQVRLVTRLA
ncbi:MAG: GNAT family N-acetyltransferase [Streptosporangiales bacterium]|nr:GNAT family N-acetyltransferase [Streptosporangiales bacterium]